MNNINKHNHQSIKYLDEYKKIYNIKENLKTNTIRNEYNKLIYDTFINKFNNDISYINHNNEIDVSDIDFYKHIYFITVTYKKKMENISFNSYKSINYINNAFSKFYTNLSIELLGKKKNRSRNRHLVPFCWMFVDVAGSRNGSLSISTRDIGVNDHHHGLMYIHPYMLQRFFKIFKNKSRFNDLQERSYYIRDIDIKRIRSIDEFVVTNDYATKAFRKLSHDCQFGFGIDMIFPRMNPEELGNYIFGN